MQRRLRPGLDRDGGHHDAVHDADVSVPADRLAARARHHLAGVRARRTVRRVAPIAPTPTPGSARACSAVDGDLGSGYVQQWNASVQRELTPNIGVEVAYVGSKITHVGIPDTNLNQLTVEQLALGAALLQRVPNPFFGIIPRSSSLGDPTIPRRAAAEAVSRSTRPSASIATTSARRSYHGFDARLEQRFSRGLSYLVGYTRSQADGRCLVGVRRVDSDRAGRELSGGRQLQSRARARLLDRRHPARLRRVRRVGPAGGAAARQRSCPACSARSPATGRWRPSSRCSRACRSPSRRRRTSTRSPASARSGRTSSAIPTLPADERTPRAGSTPPPSRSRRSSRSATPRAIRCAGPCYRNVDLALSRRVPLRAAHGARAARRSLQPAQHAAARQSERRPRLRRLRHDHDGRRSARRAAGRQAAVLKAQLLSGKGRRLARWNPHT